MTRPPASKSRIGGDDAGFVLVEVLVSAALLILVGLSVFTTLEQSDKLAMQQVRRAMAANMAQSELERIRSLPIEDVANLRGTKTVAPDTTKPQDKYYVSSSSKWVTDGADEPDCTTRSGGLDYMRITTMVAWAQAGKAVTQKQKDELPKPVVLSSIITPASRASSKTNGSLSVNIDRADAKTGVAGLAVTIEPAPGAGGGPSFTETTNQNGCVVFPFVPAKMYVLSFNRIGYVDQNSNPNIEDTVSVPAGATNKVGYLYDLAGTTSAKFITKTASLTLLGTTLASSTVKSYPKQLVLYNPDQTAGPIVETVNGPNPGGTDTWNTQKPLFPSESAYAIYAGACQENQPPTNRTNVSITAGQAQPAGNIQLPSYDIRVTDGASSILPGNPIAAKVGFYAGCGATFIDTTQNFGSLDLRSGRLADPGFPYTTGGAICVSAVISGTRYTYRAANIVNNQFDNPSIRPIILRKDGTANGTDCTA